MAMGPVLAVTRCRRRPSRRVARRQARPAWQEERRLRLLLLLRLLVRQCPVTRRLGSLPAAPPHLAAPMQVEWVLAAQGWPLLHLQKGTLGHGCQAAPPSRLGSRMLLALLHPTGLAVGPAA